MDPFLLIMISALLLDNFKYLVNDYLCQNDYANFLSICVNSLLTSGISLYTTIGCYIYTLRKIRSGIIETMTQIEQISARRHLIGLFTIYILLGLLMTIYIPARYLR